MIRPYMVNTKRIISLPLQDLFLFSLQRLYSPTPFEPPTLPPNFCFLFLYLITIFCLLSLCIPLQVLNMYVFMQPKQFFKMHTEILMSNLMFAPAFGIVLGEKNTRSQL